MYQFLILTILLAFPVLEFTLLWKLAAILGGWLLLWLIASAIAGAALLRQSPQAFASGLLQAALQGASPLRALFSGGATFLAGILLIFPGVISDFLALPLLIFALVHRRPPPPPSDGVIEGEFRRED